MSFTSAQIKKCVRGAHNLPWHKNSQRSVKRRRLHVIWAQHNLSYFPCREFTSLDKRPLHIDWLNSCWSSRKLLCMSWKVSFIFFKDWVTLIRPFCMPTRSEIFMACITSKAPWSKLKVSNVSHVGAKCGYHVDRDREGVDGKQYTTGQKE